MSLPRQALFVLGAKLIGLDCVLPLAMQLKAETPALEIHFLFLAESSRATAEQNYVLEAGMRAVGTVSVLSSATGSLGSKALAAARLVGWLLSLRRKATLLFAYYDLGSFPFRPLARACRAGGGLAVVHGKAVYPFNDALRADHFQKVAGRKMTFRDAGDRFVLWHPGQQADYRPWHEGAATILGTPRAYPAWHQHLERVTAQAGLLDKDGQPIALPPDQPVFVGFYIGWVTIPTLVRPPEDQFATFFEQVRAVCPRAKILVKPHPLCDAVKLDRALKAFADLDISVTYAHPQVLARLATVAVVANGSSVIDDIYAEGKPVLDIGAYGEGLDEGLFANQGRIGAPTAQEMAAALRQIVQTPQDLTRPEAGHLIWPKPENLLATLSGPPTHAEPLAAAQSQGSAEWRLRQ